jgi:hypothetical protein
MGHRLNMVHLAVRGGTRAWAFTIFREEKGANAGPLPLKLRHGTASSVALCASGVPAHRVRAGPDDPDLRRILDAWPTTPPAVRLEISALIGSN